MNKNYNYKKTYIDWIGEIPKEWSLIRGKFLFTSKKELNKDLQCQNLLSLTLFGVLNKDYESGDGLRPENYNTYQIFKKDDLVFKMIDLENINTSRVGLVHETGIMSSAYIRHEPIKEKIDPKFAYWFYYDLYKKEIYNSIGSGVRSTLNSSDLLEIKLPIPSLKEQKLICKYLKMKTENIDLLIKKVQKKIELLKEHRIGLINQMVTRGLKTNVEMKNSKINWIGDVPKHWKIERLKYLLKVRNNRSETGEEELLSVTINNGVVRRRDYLGNDEEHISRADTLKGYKIVFKNDLVNNIMKMSFCCLGVSKNDGIVSPGYSVFEIDQSRLIPTYLHYLLRDPRYVAEYRKRSKGIQESRMRLYDDFFLDISIPVPSLTEQSKIVNQIDNENTSKLIELENSKIQELKEYRKSLISSVVTGKIRVTEVKV